MFDKFGLLCVLSSIIGSKNEKAANVFDNIVGHVFMFILTGGLWPIILIFMKLINKRK